MMDSRRKLNSYQIFIINIALINIYLHMIQLTINGQAEQFDNPINVTQLIDHLSLQGKRIAIERNGEIVPRSQFTDQILTDGDQLEVVIAVGGG